MCGRYILVARAKQLAEYFKISLDEAIELALNPKPRYNVAPSQIMPLFRLRPEGRLPELAPLRWGLVPSWSKSSKLEYSTINAMAETVETKPAYRAAFKKRRCLVPMSGFYEWQLRADGTKQPFAIQPARGDLLAAAGVWERWEGDGEVVESYSIITTAANETMKPVHRRMPAFIAPADFATWLETEDLASAKALLGPCPEDWLKTLPVTKRVNNPRHDDAECLQPAALG